ATKRYGNMETAIKSLVLGCCLFFSVGLSAQVPVAGTLISKVVKSIDLKIQRLQNQTLFLQHLQKLLENKLHQLKLAEISRWTQKQKELYEGYFGELQQIKSAIKELK
ncbi:MAG: conjugal transfer protein TraI, partial [Bacteroidota bacterium]|nr:conjugal transfer protein TraI [Bacteroidota bacterium]